MRKASGGGEEVTNGVFALRMDSAMQWEQLLPAQSALNSGASTQPPSVYMHAACALDDGRRILVFGGCQQPGFLKSTAQLHVFDTGLVLALLSIA